MLTKKELLNNKDLLAYLKKEYLKHLKNKISEYSTIINKYTNVKNLYRLIIKIKQDEASEAIINKQFILSKTAINGLNFIKKEEETNLPKKEQPDSIPDLLRFFLLLINEDYENLSNPKLLDDLFEKILPKYKMDSLSKFFFNIIYSNFLIFIRGFDNAFDKEFEFLARAF